MSGEDENPTDAQLAAAGFDLADDLDRPDRHCDCPKCRAFYDATHPTERLADHLEG